MQQAAWVPGREAGGGEGGKGEASLLKKNYLFPTLRALGRGTPPGLPPRRGPHRRSRKGRGGFGKKKRRGRRAPALLPFGQWDPARGEVVKKAGTGRGVSLAPEGPTLTPVRGLG